MNASTGVWLLQDANGGRHGRDVKIASSVSVGPSAVYYSTPHNTLCLPKQTAANDGHGGDNIDVPHRYCESYSYHSTIQRKGVESLRSDVEQRQGAGG